MSNLKGQTELIILLGVIILGVVAALFATRTISLLPPETAEISALKASLRADIERKVSSELLSVIKTVAANGGYAQDELARFDSAKLTVDYQGSKVPYWQYQGDTQLKASDGSTVPLLRSKSDFEKIISKELGKALKLDPASFASVKGKNLEIQPVRSIEVKISSEYVTAKVDIPVYLEGYSLGGPIEPKTASQLGKAIDFGADLIGKTRKKDVETYSLEGEIDTESPFDTEKSEDWGEPTTGDPQGKVENRYFERFIINNMMVSSITQFDPNFLPESKIPLLPTQGVLIGCENIMGINKGPNDILPHLQNVIEGTLDNIYTAGKVPPGVQTFEYPANTLPIKTDLNAKFSMGKQLSTSDPTSFFWMASNNPKGADPSRVIVGMESVGFTSTCFSPPYRVIYALLFPVVAEVGDENFKLNFAFQLFINGYDPGDLDKLKADGGPSVVPKFLKDMQERCWEAVCPAKITAFGLRQDKTGAKDCTIEATGEKVPCLIAYPIDKASVSFFGCDLGKTDSRGELVAKAPCGIGELEVLSGGNKLPFKNFTSSNNLVDQWVFMPELGDVKLKIMNVFVKIDKESYTITGVEPNKDKFVLYVRYNQNAPYEPPPVILDPDKDKVLDEKITKHLIPFNAFVGLTTAVEQNGVTAGGLDWGLAGPPEDEDAELWLYNMLPEGGYPLQDLEYPPEPDDTYEDKLAKERDNKPIIDANGQILVLYRQALSAFAAKCTEKLQAKGLKALFPVSFDRIPEKDLLQECKDVKLV